MRAKRLQALLADGWVKGSGSSSAKAGMNGGMDYLCGRLVYAFRLEPHTLVATHSPLGGHTVIPADGPEVAQRLQHRRRWLRVYHHVVLFGVLRRYYDEIPNDFASTDSDRIEQVSNRTTLFIANPHNPAHPLKGI